MKKHWKNVLRKWQTNFICDHRRHPGCWRNQCGRCKFLEKDPQLCDEYEAVYIADSVQCGYGRTGKFFSHDFAGVNADIYTMAKGMGNGFPVAGIIIAPHIKPKHFQLGTTFGGNHLACAAALAVLEVLKRKN